MCLKFYTRLFGGNDTFVTFELVSLAIIFCVSYQRTVDLTRVFPASQYFHFSFDYIVIGLFVIRILSFMLILQNLLVLQFLPVNFSWDIRRTTV
jgi:hypothetical protein